MKTPYAQFFDDFVENRRLDIDDDTWTPEQRAEFRRQYEAQFGGVSSPKESTPRD